MARRMAYALSVIATAILAVAWIGAQAESHVRIIRLSYVDGQVQTERPGQGLEKAILNTPITEGLRLVTGNDGLAEIEFENNTSLRLGENSEVTFNKLVVNDAGAKVNELTVAKGTVYVDTKGNKEDIYRLSAAGSTFLVHRDSEMRLSDETGQVTAAVIKGEVYLENQAEPVKIGKKETLTVAPNGPTGYEVAKGVEAAPLDRWNNERAAYQNAYAYNNYSAGPKINAYGYSDLSYYGAWGYVNGVGMAWQPYGVSSWTGWNPYMAGAWMYDPSVGYSWASAYPWGWLPYHYGSWAYGGNSGWYWVPGSTNMIGSVTAYQPVPVVHGPSGWRPPTAPPVAANAAEYRPTVKVGMIGNVPAAIPGGRPVPNFRAVAPHSDVSFRSPGSTIPSQKNATTFAHPQPNAAMSPAQPAAMHGGHVFDVPRTAAGAAGGAADLGWGTSPMGAPHGSGGGMGMPSGRTGTTTTSGHSTTAGTHTGTVTPK